jgi:CDGSH-type Zn-finger protein
VSEVVIKSTENGPNLVIVDGKVVQAVCKYGGCALVPLREGTQKKNGFTAKQTMSKFTRENEIRDFLAFFFLHPRVSMIESKLDVF